MEKEKRKWKEWKIEELIGEGSFGKVYRITKEDFGHIYEAALKIIEIPQNTSEIENIRSEGMDDKSIYSYFYGIVEDIIKEFELMSKLKGNTNIVSYEDHMISSKDDGPGWKISIRMELLTPLEKYMKKNTFLIRDVVQLGIDICRSIELCQKKNIIHRDIKPGNIFVTEFGDYKLGDFGIARQLEKTSYAMSKKGTYDFMAPEIYKGTPYDSTVDIYSLGIVMYRYLNNNRMPFLPLCPLPITYSDKEKAMLLRIGGADMKPPCNGGNKLTEIILKACAYEPVNRYKNASDMRKDLEGVLYQNQSNVSLDTVLFRGENIVGENEDKIKECQVDETVLMFAENEINRKSIEVIGQNKVLETEQIYKCEKSKKKVQGSKIFLFYPKLIIIVILISGLFGVKFFFLNNQNYFKSAKTIEKGRCKLSENIFKIYSDTYEEYDLIINEQDSLKNMLSFEQDELLGMWSGSYTGMSNQKKIERLIDIYIGSCDGTGKVKGVAGIQNGDAGYYYFEGVADYVRGTLTFERKKWLSPNPDQLKKLTYLTTYDRNLQNFSGYIVSDPQRTISFAKTDTNPKLIQYWKKRKILMEKYN